MNELIASQQRILKQLELYEGKVDGFWGVKSFNAMAGFQLTPGYVGTKGRADNMFFSPFETLPKGWVWAEDGSKVIFDGTEEEVEDTTEADRLKAEQEAADEKKRLEDEEEARLEDEEEARLAQEKADAEKAEQDKLVAESASTTTDAPVGAPVNAPATETTPEAPVEPEAPVAPTPPETPVAPVVEEPKVEAPKAPVQNGRPTHIPFKQNR